MRYLLFILTAFQCFGAGLLSMPGTLENITPSPIRGLVAFWNFDNSGSLSNDVSYASFTTLTTGSGTNHCTYVGSPGPGTNALVGGSYGSTNNSGAYLKITSANAARLCQESSNYLSYAMWGIHWDTTAYGGMIGKDSAGSSSAGSWKSWHNGTATKSKIFSSTHTSNDAIQVNISTGNIITSNTWRYYVTTFDGTQPVLKLFIDNTNYATKTSVGITNSTSSHSFNIGTQNDTAGSSYNGCLDEIGIWSGSRGGLSPTLTQAEINFLFNSGRGRKFPFNSGP